MNWWFPLAMVCIAAGLIFFAGWIAEKKRNQDSFEAPKPQIEIPKIKVSFGRSAPTPDAEAEKKWVDLVGEKVISDINRKSAEARKKQDKFYDHLAKLKYPLSKPSVRKFTRFRLQEMRDAGIEFVRLLPSPNPPMRCASCLELQGMRIPIADATLLPFPDCDAKHCGCIWLAVK